MTQPTDDALSITMFPFRYVFDLSQACLRCIGAWPELNGALLKRAVTELHQLFCLLILLIFVNLMQTVQLILYWGDLNVMTNVLSTADLPIANVTFMMIKFWYKRQVLRDLVSMVRADWSRDKTTEELEIMNRNAITARTLSTICVTLGQGACLFYLVLHVYLQFTLDLDEPLLYLNAHVPYDYKRKAFYYKLTWICQCMSTFISTAGFIGFESFFVVVVMHICGQLNYLSCRLKNLKPAAGGFRKELSAIVEHHNYLYRVAKSVEDIFNSVNLVQLINFTIIFCLLGFRVVTMFIDKDGTLIEAIFVVGFFTYLSSNLFICCYVAEQLRSESMAVKFAAYESSWYDLASEEAKPLILVLLRARKPFEITAGKFFVFSLDTFTSLMRTSGSYLSVLLALKNNGE